MHGKFSIHRQESSVGRFFIEASGPKPVGSPHGSILEVAPGPGYLSIELAKLGEYGVTGVDISRTFVEIATANAARAKVKATFQVGNASQLPFQEAQFDYVVCRAAFKNFTEPIAALHEMFRVLKPGGRALVIDLNRSASVESLEQFGEQMKMSRVNLFINKLIFRHMLLKRAYTNEDFEAMVARTAFRSARIETDLASLEVLMTKTA